VGTVLSVAGVGLLVLTVIEAPRWGWTSAATVAGFALAAGALVAFVRWELRTARPLIDVRIFRIPRFSAAAGAVAVAFFALFGFIFMVTQYFQFVRGYDPLSAGLHTVPFAVFTGVASPIAAKAAQRVGTKALVSAGLASMAVGFATIALYEADSPYLLVVLSMLFMGGGLGLVNAPATEAIMGALPPERAGVGSAVNDTTRELGGTMGVAVVGSLFASVFGANLRDALAGAPIPPEALDTATSSMGAALAVAEQAPAPFGAALATAAVDAFMDGFIAGSLAAAAVAAVGAVVALRFLPARPATT
jgi:hypothetical protein